MLEGCYKVCPEPSLQAKQPQLSRPQPTPSCPSARAVLRPPIISVPSFFPFPLPHFHCLLLTDFPVWNSEAPGCSSDRAAAVTGCVPWLNPVCLLGKWHPGSRPEKGLAEVLGDAWLMLGCSSCPFSYSAETLLDERLCSPLPSPGAVGQRVVPGKPCGYQTSSCEHSLRAPCSLLKARAPD